MTAVKTMKAPAREAFDRSSADAGIRSAEVAEAGPDT